MAQWRFPLSDGGEKQGYNATYEAKFREKRIRSMTREICQNSLDARRGLDPAFIEFHAFQLARKQFPDAVRFQNYLQACLDYSYQHKKKTEVKFLQRALQSFKQEKIPVLRISDHNTTGVRQSNSEWDNLIRSSGFSSKQGGSAGSYGIGKQAPFVCSDMRTIFYSTNTCEHQQMHEGVTHLVYFATNDGKEYQNVGYYCEGKSNFVAGQCFMDPGYKRAAEDYGTDIYVIGFNAFSQDGWQDEILATVANDFLLAVYENTLIVDVEGRILNRETMGEYVLQMKRYFPGSENYYRALTDSQSAHCKIPVPCIEPGKDIGTIEIWLTKEGENLQRHVRMFRENGMQIQDKNRYSSLPFAAVCQMQGNELNEMLRMLENPEHTGWIATLLEEESERKKADKFLKSLNRLIRNYILQELQAVPLEKVDVKGAGLFLPDIAEEALKNKSDQEGNADMSDEMIDIRSVGTGTPLVTPAGNSQQEGIAYKEDNDDQNTQITPPDKSDDTKTGSTSSKNHQKAISKKSSSENDNASDTRRVAKQSPIKVSSISFFCKNPNAGEYLISITPAENGRNGILALYLSAENNSIPAYLFQASLNKKNLKVKGNCIHGLKFCRNKKMNISFKMNTKTIYAIEVKAYAIKK